MLNAIAIMFVSLAVIILSLSLVDDRIKLDDRISVLELKIEQLKKNDKPRAVR